MGLGLGPGPGQVRGAEGGAGGVLARLQEPGLAGAGAAGLLPVLQAAALREAEVMTCRHLGVFPEPGVPPDVTCPAPEPRAARAQPRAPSPAPCAKPTPSRFLLLGWGDIAS